MWRRRGLKARSSERSVKEPTERTFGVRRVKRPACVCSWPLGSRRPVGQSAVCPTCEDCGPGSPTLHNDQNPLHCDRGSALSHCRTAARRWPIRRPGAAGGRGETGSSRRLVAAPIVWRLAWAGNRSPLLRGASREREGLRVGDPGQRATAAPHRRVRTASNRKQGGQWLEDDALVSRKPCDSAVSSTTMSHSSM